EFDHSCAIDLDKRYVYRLAIENLRARINCDYQ
ncbi:hypothetical protein Pgy4_37246, partial [Pseudomonas savastanoi pv. glycinea str. race 4]